MGLFAALVLASLLATVAAVAAPRLRSPWRVHVARASLGLGLLVLAVGFVGTVAGAIHTLGAAEASALSEADRQRILSNGIAEGMYNLVFALVLGLPPAIVGWLVRRSGER